MVSAAVEVGLFSIAGDTSGTMLWEGKPTKAMAMLRGRAGCSEAVRVRPALKPHAGESML